MCSDSIRPNDRLRQERITHNWRQQDLADQVGTTVVTVTRWERGNQQPSTYFRVKLCALFGKSAEELGLIPKTASHAGVTEVSASEEHPSTSILPEEAPIWSVPFRRNPFFTAHTSVLEHLQTVLTRESTIAHGMRNEVQAS